MEMKETYQKITNLARRNWISVNSMHQDLQFSNTNDYSIIVDKCYDVLYDLLGSEKNKYLLTKSNISWYLLDVIELSLTDIWHLFCKGGFYESAVWYFIKSADRIGDNWNRLNYFQWLYEQYRNIPLMKAMILEEAYGYVNYDIKNSEQWFDIITEITLWYWDSWHLNEAGVFSEQWITLWKKLLKKNVNLKFWETLFWISGSIMDVKYKNTLTINWEESVKYLDKAIEYYEIAKQCSKNWRQVAMLNCLQWIAYKNKWSDDKFIYSYFKKSTEYTHIHYWLWCLELAKIEFKRANNICNEKVLKYIDMLTIASNEKWLDSIWITKENISIYYNFYANCIFNIKRYEQAYRGYELLWNTIKDVEDLSDRAWTPIAESLKNYFDLKLIFDSKHSRWKTNIH